MGTVTTTQKKTCRYYVQIAIARHPLTKGLIKATAGTTVENDMLKERVTSRFS